MKRLTSDAKNFVKGIVDHLQKEKQGDRPIPKIKSLLKKVSDEAWNGHTATVTTAVPLALSEREALIKVLSLKMGQPVSLSCTVQPDIIGGIRIEIADYIIDTGYKEKLAVMETMLLKGNHI